MTPCFFIQESRPKVVIVFVYPLNGNQAFAAKAIEFVASYEKNPPGMDHDTVIVCNGEPASESSKALFNSLPNVTFIDHDNSGWDIGAFQLAARTVEADLMVFFGSHAYFRKPGWLKRMVEVAEEKGNTLYGCTGSLGNIAFGVYPHVRTTGFWCHPSLMAQYPIKVTQAGTGGGRYNFEHGENCFTNWIIIQGMQPYIVGWDCVWPLHDSGQMPGGMHNGTQYNLLCGDRLTTIPFHHAP